jgi:hypothetical protein
LRLRKAPAWTDEENERLKRLATSGGSIVRAAAALGRSMISVRDQARKLGTPFPVAADRQREVDGSFQ